MEMFLVLVLGFLIGAALTWYHLQSRRNIEAEEIRSSLKSKIKHLEGEVKNADTAHEETKSRLRDLESQNQRCGARVGELEARLHEAHALTERANKAQSNAETALDEVNRQSAADQRELTETKGQTLELEARLRTLETQKSGSAPSDFGGGRTSSAAAAPAPETKQLKALDAKIRQLPAGSSARSRFESERAALLGQRSDKADTADRTEAEDRLEQIFEPPSNRSDDLKNIKGIGPVLEKKLHKLGIKTFAQVAALDPNDIVRIDEVLDFKGRIERERWVAQARDLA